MPTTFDVLMYDISREDYEAISTERDLSRFLLMTTFYNRDRDLTTCMAAYSTFRRQGERKGQAFMNALPEEMYRKLTGTLLDPFHKDELLFKALDYLILSE